MADILISWQLDHGDWVISGGDLRHDDDLVSAIVVSLFTDGLAPPDYVPTDGTTDLRGWWGDSYADVQGDHIGSLLWRYMRAKILDTTLASIEQDAEAALAWMLTDGVAASVTATATRYNAIRILLQIVIVKPDGSVLSPRFVIDWNTALAALANS